MIVKTGKFSVPAGTRRLMKQLGAVESSKPELQPLEKLLQKSRHFNTYIFQSFEYSPQKFSAFAITHVRIAFAVALSLPTFLCGEVQH